ncbi:hypothetical protein NCCNTM_55300 [Mycolicibacterium sp. NCC-Tsukiji]|nr:hypothetical protein NCCNTM_55300 [Mycolicibacterium sp. NCC-Tsukiji]
MDNGLIFPYPCVCVRDESIVLTIQMARDDPFGDHVLPAAWDPGG